MTMMTPELSQEAVKVDFRRPPRVAKERLKALEVMHDRFVKSLEGWLITRTRGDLELKLASVKQIPIPNFFARWNRRAAHSSRASRIAVANRPSSTSASTSRTSSSIACSAARARQRFSSAH